MELPDETLKKVLPKVSMRLVSRLIAAYPRAVGRNLLNAMGESVSPSTLEFLREQLGNNQLPSMYQIMEAEKEFVRTLREENLLPAAAAH
jgi:hypothetical protein